jgi:hypothetical protein
VGGSVGVRVGLVIGMVHPVHERHQPRSRAPRMERANCWANQFTNIKVGRTPTAATNSIKRQVGGKLIMGSCPGAHARGLVCLVSVAAYRPPSVPVRRGIRSPVE